MTKLKLNWAVGSWLRCLSLGGKRRVCFSPFSFKSFCDFKIVSCDFLQTLDEWFPLQPILCREHSAWEREVVRLLRAMQEAGRLVAGALLTTPWCPRQEAIATLKGLGQDQN